MWTFLSRQDSDSNGRPNTPWAVAWEAGPVGMQPEASGEDLELLGETGNLGVATAGRGWTGILVTMAAFLP